MTTVDDSMIDDLLDERVKAVNNLIPTCFKSKHEATNALLDEFGLITNASRSEYLRLREIFQKLSGPHGIALWKAHLAQTKKKPVATTQKTPHK